MKKKTNLLFLIIATIAVILLTSFGISQIKTARQDSKLKIGVYDSRAVVYAYVCSDMFKQEQQKTGEQRSEIMKSNDTAKWKEAMTMVCTEQYLLHQRVFATGSAASILKKIESQIPAIAKNAGVDIIVSRWELTWNDSKASFVDLTDSIAQSFVPLSKLGKTYGEIKNSDRMDVEEVGIGEVIEIWQQFEKKYLGKQ